MHSYPLKFKVDGTPADSELVIQDAEKKVILFRHKISEAMADGRAPCIIYTDKASRQPVYNTIYRKNADGEGYLIRTPGEAVLGELTTDGPRRWKVMDEHGAQVAVIQEKSAWKNSCLFELLTFPLDLMDNSNLKDTVMKMIAPHRYIVNRDGGKLLELKETLSTISDDYSLKKKGDFSEREETLLLVGLITALGLKE